MSLGMFSAIPLPRHLWDDACLHLLLPCFPIIGILLGALWWGVAQLLLLSAIHIVLIAAILTVTPFLLTGFLHLDGYMDTSDAVLSRRGLEEKLRILKDPHTGAFSVVMLAILFLWQFAAVYAVVDLGKNLLLLVFIAVISRCCASLSLLSLHAMPQSGYANLLKQNTRRSHTVFVTVVAVFAIAASLLLAGLPGLATVGAVIVGFAAAMAYSYTAFHGISGDLTGFSLVISELCGLIILGVMP